MGLIKRLYKVGEYSYVVIVPKEWLMRHNKPSKVEIRVKRNRLIVVPIKTNKETSNANKRQ